MYGKNSTGQSVQLLNAVSPMSFALTLQMRSPIRLPAYRAAGSDVKTASAGALYLCPMANEIGCTQTFTTSGHASRHARGHTGKKYSVCPDCDKSFTRKDNMEQHRLTHLQLKQRRVRVHTRRRLPGPTTVEDILNRERKARQSREDSVMGPQSMDRVERIDHAITAQY